MDENKEMGLNLNRVQIGWRTRWLGEGIKSMQTFNDTCRDPQRVVKHVCFLFINQERKGFFKDWAQRDEFGDVGLGLPAIGAHFCIEYI